MRTHVTDQQRGSPSAGSGAAAAARTIDELLFEPGSWRALDAANTQVPGVRAGSLADALALVGRGPVATVYGRLRAGVAVVDVDMARGAPVVAELVAWCAERDLWHVARPSGQPGHGHVFVVIGDRVEALGQFCERLRAAHRVGRAAIDLRDTVRPLSAPHRSGAIAPPLPPRLPAAARGLSTALAALPDRPAIAPRPVTRISAQQPPARPRRALPAHWADYLATGVPPARSAGWADASRSAVESTATWQMAAAGWSPDQAWLAIGQAHPRAFTKARSKGRRWWVACVWNRAVADLRHQPPRPSCRADPAHDDLADRIGALRGAFLACWTTCYPDPRRHTLRRVLDVLLDRMIRTGQARVPCPQRDLVADTGLTRPTIAAALDQLHDAGWIVLHRSFDPATDTPEARSHHAQLPDRPPRPAPQGGVLSSSLPPSSFTPRPPGSPAPVAVAALLGARVWHLYLALLGRPTSVSPPDVAHDAGWGPPGMQQASARTQRTVLAGLVRLAHAGLAVCDEHGQWTARDLGNLASATAQVAVQAHQHRAEQIGAERVAYTRVRVGRGRWHTQREQAIQRGATARQLGAQKWWTSLNPADQASRRQCWAERYRSLPPAEQGRVKHLLAARRQVAGGLSEDQLHQAWQAGLSETEYHSRAAARTTWYRSLEPRTQLALVAVWEQHRTTWAIQRRTHSPTPAMSPAQRAAELLRLDQAVAAAYDLLEAELGALAVTTSHSTRRESA